MAGLGETCTHIAAVLFYVEAKARLAGSSTCTQKKCQWIIPSYTKDLPYLTISDIDFASAAAKKKKLDDAVDQALESCSSKMNLKKTTSKEPTSEEMELLYKELSECGTNLVLCHSYHLILICMCQMQQNRCIQNHCSHYMILCMLKWNLMT